MFGIELDLKRVFLLPMVLAFMCVVVARVEEDSPRQQRLVIICRREQSAVL